jgi:hypothetical protein
VCHWVLVGTAPWLTTVWSLDRNKQRNSLSEVYFGKTKDIVAELRSIEGSEVKNREHELRKELLGAFGRRAPVS